MKALVKVPRGGGDDASSRSSLPQDISQNMSAGGKQVCLDGKENLTTCYWVFNSCKKIDEITSAYIEIPSTQKLEEGESSTVDKVAKKYEREKSFKRLCVLMSLLWAFFLRLFPVWKRFSEPTTRWKHTRISPQKNRAEAGRNLSLSVCPLHKGAFTGKCPFVCMRLLG